MISTQGECRICHEDDCIICTVNYFPIAYAFMQRKDKDAYLNVLQTIKSLFMRFSRRFNNESRTLQPSKFFIVTFSQSLIKTFSQVTLTSISGLITADGDHAQYLAVQSAFPGTQIAFCSFHILDNVKTKFRRTFVGWAVSDPNRIECEKLIKSMIWVKWTPTLVQAFTERLQTLGTTSGQRTKMGNFVKYLTSVNSNTHAYLDLNSNFSWRKWEWASMISQGTQVDTTNNSNESSHAALKKKEIGRVNEHQYARLVKIHEFHLYRLATVRGNINDNLISTRTPEQRQLIRDRRQKIRQFHEKSANAQKRGLIHYMVNFWSS